MNHSTPHRPRSRSAAAACGLAILLAATACKGADGQQTPEAIATGGAVDATPLPGGMRIASMPVFAQSNEPLTVVRTQPEDGAIDVAATDGRLQLAVQFNHPVVPLVGVEDEGTLPQPLTLEPSVAGAGSWLNTSTYVFHPADDLRASTRYTVRVAGDLTDVLGGRLAEAHVFAFTTVAPRVDRTQPDGESAVDVAATRPVSVTFTQAMDPASTAAAFRLERVDKERTRVAGRATWLGDRTMVFTPDATLDRKQRYEAIVAAGARDAARVAVTKEDVRWAFTTADLARVTRTTPGDGVEDSEWLRGNNMTIQFSAPMDEAKLKVTIQPTITSQTAYLGDNGRTAYIGGGWLASESYTVRIAGTSLSEAGEPMGEDAVVRFSVAPMKPSAWIETPADMSFLNAYSPARLYVGAVNRPAVELSAYRIPGKDYRDLLRGDRRLDLYRAPSTSLTQRWKVQNDGKLNAVRYISTAISADASGLLAPGPYLVQLGDERELMLASKVNLALKRTDREALVWATDVKTGQPVPNLPITIYGPNDRSLASGRTDADGVYRGSFDPLDRNEGWWNSYAVSEAGGTVVAATGGDWQSGMNPYDFNLAYTFDRQPYYGDVYTDRPIYRPGQTVYFRGVVRSDDDARYGLPTAKRIAIRATDGDGKSIYQTELTIGPFGTFNGSLDLGSVAALGYYNLEARLVRGSGRPEGGTPTPGNAERSFEDADTIWTVNHSFQVAAYRKPEYQVDVQTDKPAYRQGDTIHATVAGSYYFGGPVADAKVHWRLLADDYFFASPDGVKGWWDWIDYDWTESRYWKPDGGVVRDGEAVLDADGAMTLDVPADVGEAPIAQVLTLDVEVTDINHQAVSSRASTVVHKADLYVGLRPREYIGTAGRPADIDVLTVSSEGITATNQAVDLSYEQREWYSVKEKREDGQFYWTSRYTDTLLSRATTTTNARGAASGRFTPPRAGVYRVVAEAKDAAGRTAKSATYLWVAGGGFTNWRQENNDRIQLVPDKKAYAPGDTARILVPAPFAGAQALVTTERAGIRSVRRITLAGNSETVEIPITEDDTPNIYVSVMLVKGTGPDSPVPQFKLGYTNLSVSSAGKVLNVAVTTDRPGPFQPRDTVRYQVSVTDSAGRPAKTELSLALVDKALLALTGPSGPNLVDTFYGERMLGVSTSASLARSTDRLNAQLAADKKGGGGGLPEPGTVRRLFRDTAYWNGALVTGADGKAAVDVPLPDNLTTWNMAVYGVTGADTRVGAGTLDIVSTKSLLLRPALPRFVVVGDALSLEAAVQNQTDKAVDVEAVLAVEGLTVEGDVAQRVALPAGGKAELVWPVRVPATGLRPATVPGADGEAMVKIHVQGGGREDAIEVPLPVYMFTAPATVATAGMTQGSVMEVIRPPAGVQPSQGTFKVEVSPSLAAASTDSLVWLQSYAYDCTEQTVSKFLPNVVSYKALRDLGLERPALARSLEQAVATQLQRLYGYQRGDGGWGWFGPRESGESFPWLSAYALYGLEAAKAAGFAIDDEVLERAHEYLKRWISAQPLRDRPEELNERALVLFALGEADDLPASAAVSLYDRRDHMARYARALLAVALADATSPDDPRVKSLLADLNSAAVLSATGTSWEEPVQDRWNGNTNTRTTAIVLLALARLRPDDASLPNIVRWLMVNRDVDHWATTQETAWSVLAFTEQMKASGELKANFSWDVTLGNRTLGSGTVDAANVDQPQALTASMADVLGSNGGRLSIAKTGAGRVYYGAWLRYFVPAADAPPVDHGIGLGRQYLRVDPRTLKATGEPATDVKVGDYVQVKLTLIVPHELRFVSLEDPLPAGFEAVDTTLRTSTAAASGPEFNDASDSQNGSEADRGWWDWDWWSYWVASQLRDEKVAAFAEVLGPGTYDYTYLARAGVAGTFNVIPALVQEMYFPEVFGRSAGGVLTVGQGD
ncbi:MAG: Ig-like domain-containing protein [Ardenticatenales bacterium]